MAAPDFMTKKTKSRKRGPTPETRDRVVRAVGELLRHDGLEAVTAQRIFERTGIARTTIYRHWPGRNDLIRLLLERATFPHHQTKLTGVLRDDLEEAVGLLMFRFRRRPMRSVLIALMECGRQSPDMLAVSEEYVTGLLRPIRDVIESGIESGELHPRPGGSREARPLRGQASDSPKPPLEGGKPPVPVDDMVAVLTGPLMLQHVLLRQEVSDVLVNECIDAFLARYRSP